MLTLQHLAVLIKAIAGEDQTNRLGPQGLELIAAMCAASMPSMEKRIREPGSVAPSVVQPRSCGPRGGFWVTYGDETLPNDFCICSVLLV